MLYSLDTERSGSRYMKPVEYLALAVVALLFALWPIPHSISLRDTLLFLALVLVGYLAYQKSGRETWSLLWRLRLPIVLCCATTVWIVIVAIFISRKTLWSLDEVRGHWLKPMLAGALGMLAAVAGCDQPMRRRMLLAICFAVTLHLLYVDVVGLSDFFKPGGAPFRIAGLTEGPDKSSYLVNYFVVFLLAEVVVRITYQRRELPFGPAVVFLLGVITLGALYFASVRNGIIELSFVSLLGSGVVLFLNRKHWRRPRVILITATLLLIPLAQGFLNYKADGRWEIALRTIPVAWDTDRHKAWLNDQKYAFPTLPDGRAVDSSTYLRVAWFKEGMRAVFENPMGIGFGRNAFGHVRFQKYGEGGRGHSHSGIIDLAIGIGVPGVLLWVAFLVSLLYYSYRSWFVSSNYYAFVLFFLVATFSFRMIVDSVIRDHMLQMFMFLIGLSAAGTALATGSGSKKQPVLAPPAIDLKKTANAAMRS